MFTRRDFTKMAGAAFILGATPLRSLAKSNTSLTVAVDNLWQNMEPVLGISATSRRIFNNFYNALTQRDYINDPNGLIIAPALATAWKQNGKVWEFTLRENVMFHHGIEMTADDVAFTLSKERLWGEKPIAPRGKTFTEGFVRVEATGKYTVEIETANEDPYMPQKLSGMFAYVVPKKHYLEVGADAFGQKPIGTGPYKVTTFRSGEVMVLEAFDEYWDGRPSVDKITWQIVPEYSARLAGLVSGEYDFIVSVPSDQKDTVKSYSNIKYVSRMADNYPFIAFNTRPDPEDNPLVDPSLRYALVQGVDMKAITAALWGDETYHPEVPFNFEEYGKFYDPSLPVKLPFDAAKAKELVSNSNYQGQELRWHITRGFYPNYDTAAEIMIEQWREIGLNVQPYFLDSFELVYRRPYHLMNMGQNSGFIPGDPYQPLWLDWNAAATRSSASWKVWDPTPEFLDLGKKFASAVDFEERKAGYLALSQEWQRVTPGMFMWKSVYSWAHRADIDWTPIADTDMRMFGDYLKFKS
ncbi:ABC transporter substrate-binding protein [Brucellaceae bacterium D45D]